MAVDLRDQTVTVKHDAIPGYMDAMTMPFHVQDARMMSALEAGRLLTADLVVSGRSSWLENIVVSTRPGIPTTPSRVEGAVEPTPGQLAPEFSLVDEHGAPATLSRYRGKVVALTFIYTRCPLPDYCPLMTENFAAAERLVQAKGAPAAAVEFLSISIDPEHDTPDVMLKYAKAFAANPDGRVPQNWAFLTGSPEAVRAAAQAYGLIFETDGDQIVHSLRTAVVTPNGTLATVFRGNDWTPEDLVAAIDKAAE